MAQCLVRSLGVVERNRCTSPVSKPEISNPPCAYHMENC